MKHTPGPWHADGDNVKCKDGVIANTYDPNEATQHTKVSEANTHLIAAAPDLLEACYSSCVLCQIMPSYKDNCEPCTIGKAIKKAEGR